MSPHVGPLGRFSCSAAVLRFCHSATAILRHHQEKRDRNMADVADPEENEEERRIRSHQEEMERLLLDQETEQQQEEDRQEVLQHALNNEGNGDENMNNNLILGDAIEGGGGGGDAMAGGTVGGFRQKMTYTQSSFLAALVTIVYALRTRGQWYMALVYLSSSKWAYCVLGNALVALAVQVFSFTTNFFLQGGLRIHEAEGLQDFFRWNVTETCLALTMFRSELTVTTSCEFLCLILAKSLHHVAAMRQNHLRMTDDAVQPASWNPNIPTIPMNHVRVLLFLLLLQLLDLCALHYTAQILLASGPSVSILFAFEAAILLASAWSHLLLWHLHVFDGLLHFAHDLGSQWGHKWLHTWKEHKATLTFAVELQAQAVQFLFYLSFFGFVLTYYGVPINLFREVYMSFSALKERMVAFFKYRRLMAEMNRFANPTEEELDEAGRICIICRDEMTIHDCKKLPVCGHIFHKSCLREWLTQQQTCPTCRSDIVANQALETTRNAAAAAAAVRQESEAPAAGAEEGTEPATDPATTTRTTTEEDDSSPANENDSSDKHQQQHEQQQNDEEKSRPASGSLSSKLVEPQNGESSRSVGTENDVGARKKPAVSSSEGLSRSTDDHASDRATAAVTAKSDDSSWCDLVSETTSPPQYKGKGVRFSDNVLSFNGGKTPPASRFPAMYRVVNGNGARVWWFPPEDEEGEKESGNGQQLFLGSQRPFVIRIVPLSVVVLGEKEEAKFLPEFGPRETSFVRIPDGWVNEDEILRVYTMDWVSE